MICVMTVSGDDDNSNNHIPDGARDEEKCEFITEVNMMMKILLISIRDCTLNPIRLVKNSGLLGLMLCRHLATETVTMPMTKYCD